MTSLALLDGVVDVGLVHKTIQEHEQAISLLGEQIEALFRSARQLQFQQEQHRIEIRKCMSQITLARRLPPEILASIFEECVYNGWTRTPLVVSHVCSSWRKAALIPTVWSHVYVNLEGRDPYHRTVLWLKRSQETPLAIDIEIGQDISQLNNIVQLLKSEIRRWKTLTIKSRFLDPVNQVIRLCDASGPQLQAVHLLVEQEFTTVDPNNNDHELMSLRSFAERAPQLRSLFISRNILPGLNVIPPSIKELSLRLPYRSNEQPVSAIIRLLNELPNLERFKLEVPSPHDQQFTTDLQTVPTVELAHLKAMSIMGANNIFGFLPHIRAPILTDLSLRSSLERVQSENLGLWILDFLRESTPPISLLEFRDLEIDHSIYTQLFSSLPMLEELRLHDSDILDDVLQQLGGPDAACPLLQRLDLRWCGRVSGRALVELVGRRLLTENEGTSVNESVSPAPIAEITLINCSFVKEEDLIELAEMTVCRLMHGGQSDFCCACNEA